MLTPLNIAEQGLVRAYLEIIVPKVDDPIIPLKFNPTEYQLQKKNNFSDISIPGLESPPIQFVRGGSETLTAELLVDTSDTLEDVRDRYTKKLRNLMRIKEEVHAPPIVRFMWGSEVFKGVVESLNINYILFTPEGIPIRAKLNITLKEYRPVDIQVKESRKASPDFDKTYVMNRGETLASISAKSYNDASLWREIAVASGIQDPRQPQGQVQPGQTLNIPRLR